MDSSHYFSVQKLTFAGVGIQLIPGDTKSIESLIRQPFLLYGILLSSFFHLTLVTHYIYVHITDFLEVTDSMPLFCHLILCILKMVIFLRKRKEIVLLVTEIHQINLQAKEEEMFILRRENARENFLSTAYLRMVIATGSVGILHPVIYGLYAYFASGEIVLADTNKATYFWNHSHLPGYSVVYVLNVFSLYFVCTVSLALNTLFFWFVSNIVIQFHIIGYRFEQLGVQRAKLTFNACQQRFYADFIACVQQHRQALRLADKLNHVYGEMIFVKFLISCTEICSLIFRVGRHNDSVADVAYKTLFLSSLALQLMLYCWNGQRIKDESMQLATIVYLVFDWDALEKFYNDFFSFVIVRSQRCSRVTGVFFDMDLALYLWVFKTATSLLTALKTMDENQA